MGNVVVPIRIHGTAKWRRYGTAGLGVIRAGTNESRIQRRRRCDVLAEQAREAAERLRYVRAFVDENKREGVVFRDYGFLRVSFGVTFGFPAQ
jgi:hypothetical protein